MHPPGWICPLAPGMFPDVVIWDGHRQSHTKGKFLDFEVTHARAKCMPLCLSVGRKKFSHTLVWLFELGLRTPTLRFGHLSGLSSTRRGFFYCEVGHDGAYKGRVHVIVPFWGQKMGI